MSTQTKESTGSFIQKLNEADRMRLKLKGRTPKKWILIYQI